MTSRSRASCGVVAVSTTEPCLPLTLCCPADPGVTGSSLDGEVWFPSTSVLLEDRPLCGRPIRGDFEGFMVDESQALADTFVGHQVLSRGTRLIHG